MSKSQLCPCGSEQSLTQCCLPVIEGKKEAPTAESLLRARYTAFTRGAIDFIYDTHHTRTRESLNREEIEQWSKGSEWLGLKILQSEAGQPKDEMGTVIFHARYVSDGKLNDHYEKSLFEREAGAWRFLDAQPLKGQTMRRTEPKINRNDPCSCGSGKKYKKCCAA